MDFYFNSWRDILFAKLARPPQILCAKRFLYIPNNDTNNLSAPISLFPSFKKILFFASSSIFSAFWTGLFIFYIWNKYSLQYTFHSILCCPTIIERRRWSFNSLLFVASEDQSIFDIWIFILISELFMYFCELSKNLKNFWVSYWILFHCTIYFMSHV